MEPVKIHGDASLTFASKELEKNRETDMKAVEKLGVQLIISFTEFSGMINKLLWKQVELMNLLKRIKLVDLKKERNCSGTIQKIWIRFENASSGSKSKKEVVYEQIINYIADIPLTLPSFE